MTITTITTEPAALISALTAGAATCSRDRTLPALCCMRVTVEDGTMTVRSTDRYRMTLVTLPAVADQTRAVDMLIERTGAEALVKTLIAAARSCPRASAFITTNGCTTADVSVGGMTAGLRIDMPAVMRYPRLEPLMRDGDPATGGHYNHKWVTDACRLPWGDGPIRIDHAGQSIVIAGTLAGGAAGRVTIMGVRPGASS